MNSRWFVCLIGLACLGLLIGASDPAPEAPSVSDIHQLFDQGNYTEAAAQLSIQHWPQKEQPGDDRFDLLQLKGETLLRTKSDTEGG